LRQSSCIESGLVRPVAGQQTANTTNDCQHYWPLQTV
jgi:hypothetical protein